MSRSTDLVFGVRCFLRNNVYKKFCFTGKPTGRTRFYALSPISGKPIRVDDGKGKLPPGQIYEFKCMAKRYEHPQTMDTGSRFIKKVFVLTI